VSRIAHYSVSVYHEETGLSIGGSSGIAKVENIPDAIRNCLAEFMEHDWQHVAIQLSKVKDRR
jgi:hypothetical protein